MSATHPDIVKGLILLSTCAKLPENNSSPGRLLWYLPGPIRKAIFFSLAKKILFAPGASRQARLVGMEDLQTCRPETILKDLAAARAMDLEEVARGLRVPTLILCGSRDGLTPPIFSERPRRSSAEDENRTRERPPSDRALGEEVAHVFSSGVRFSEEPIGLGISPKRAKSRYRIQLRAYTPQ